jgi:hypothetical protein
MSKSSKPPKSEWVDPDDAPEWTDEQFERAAIYEGDRLVRSARGTLTRDFREPEKDPRRP